MELWDLYDQNRMKLDKTIERGKVMEPGTYHVVVHVCIFNKKNQLLIQQRQPFKEGWPNMWDLTVGGSALSGETSQQAAMRETLEEIGYPIDLQNERPYFTINFPRGFDDYYLVEREIERSDLKLQVEEVQAVKWATKEEVLALVKEGKFIDYYFLELLFEMRKKRGAIRR